MQGKKKSTRKEDTPLRQAQSAQMLFRCLLGQAPTTHPRLSPSRRVVCPPAARKQTDRGETDVRHVVRANDNTFQSDHHAYRAGKLPVRHCGGSIPFVPPLLLLWGIHPGGGGGKAYLSPLCGVLFFFKNKKNIYDCSCRAAFLVHILFVRRSLVKGDRSPPGELYTTLGLGNHVRHQ